MTGSTPNWLLTTTLTVTGVAVGATETCVSFRSGYTTGALRVLGDGTVLYCGRQFDLGDDLPCYLGLVDEAVAAGVGATLSPGF